MSKNGMQLAKTGFDVSTATTDEMYIDTDTPLLKIYTILRGTLYYNPNIDNFAAKAVFHGLGYVPACMMFMERVPGGNRQLVLSNDTDFNDTFNIKNLLVTGFPDTIQFNYIPSNAAAGGLAGYYNWTLIIFYDQVANNG